MAELIRTLTTRLPWLAPIALALLAGCESGSGDASDALVPNGPTSADSIFTGGEILTVDDDFSIAEAIAVRGNRVLAVGTDDDILALAGPATRRTDLEGRTVVPGLIDNHMHFVRATRDWYRHVRWDGITSRAQALAMLTEKAAELPNGEWVLVIGGWIHAQFVDNSATLSLEELDAAVGDRPLYIQEGYRRGFVNSAALEAAGIDEPSAEISGAKMALLTSQIPDVPDEIWDQSLREAVDDLHAMGLTTIYDVGGNSVTPAHYEAVQRAAADGSLTMRVFHSLNGQKGVGGTAGEIIAALSSTSPDLDGLEFAEFGWGESTYAPMRAQPWRIGSEDLELYEAIALAAAEHGWQMHEHSMRDEKIDAMLTVFESVDRTRPITALRWTIAHTNGISRQSIERANALGMVFAVHSSSRLATPEAIAAGAAVPPIRAIDESGGVWGLGSDATTVASPNPFHNIGWVVSGLSPSGDAILTETVSREAALRAHTRTNAYILFREEHLGSIESGKLADFVVLDRPYLDVPADEIKDLKSVMTVVDGNVVFSGR